LPARTGSGLSALVTARSARVLTVVVAVATLFAVVGSAVVLRTVAVFVSVALLAALGLTVTTMVSVAVAPAATVHRLALPTPPAWVAVPLLEVTETKLVLPGRLSVSETPWASLGPLFATDSV